MLKTIMNIVPFVSLPVRECGLKLADTRFSDYDGESLPVRECGLKSYYFIVKEKAGGVTPRAGVWIEMLIMWEILTNSRVTPRAGVWIEMATTAATGLSSTCHSPCGSVDCM